MTYFDTTVMCLDVTTYVLSLKSYGARLLARVGKDLDADSDYKYWSETALNLLSHAEKDLPDLGDDMSGNIKAIIVALGAIDKTDVCKFMYCDAYFSPAKCSGRC
jgi:hypothetical protein